LERSIRISGARTHNLRNLSFEIPHGKLTVVTGVSGSGKSSLVFDTLYAEGQRRYVQSLSTYARLFLERMERPDVDAISNIPPALALRQKNTIRNARSTVGTVTEINDYLRLLFATIGATYCPQCEIQVMRDSVESAAGRILGEPGLYVFIAPFALGSRSPGEAAAYLVQNGYHRLFRDSAFVETADFPAAAAKAEELMVVIDRVSVEVGAAEERVREALEKSFYLGGGRARAIRVARSDGTMETLAELDFDRRFNCSRCGSAFPEPSPALFSSNSPIGACPDCEGFGRTVELDLEKVMPNPRLSLRQGLVAPWRTPAYREMQDWMLRCARRAHVRRNVPWREMNDEERAWLLDGEPRDEGEKRAHDRDRWPGVRGFFRWLEGRRYKTHVRILLARYRRFVTCPACGGSKLRPEALNVRVGDQTLPAVGRLPVRDLSRWVAGLAERPAVNRVAGPLLRELANRAEYLNAVGLGYLTLERQARTLSGGEAQRIHLASALGNLLTGTLYALDEPTVGLHPSDARRLLDVLRRLRDLGNTVVVVEHDPTLVGGADHVAVLGPGGGRDGGELVYVGRPRAAALRNALSAPGRVLLMRALARERRFGRRDPAVRIVGAREHNLRNLSVAIPLGRLVCITGVSGSGKSTLVEEVLYANWQRHAGETVSEVGACDAITGLDAIGEMVHMGQELPARSIRSNLATYLKIYDDIRRLFAASAEARKLGVTARHFSFNVSGGRCDRCRGTGTVTIEMHFMADLEVRCENCDGRRFQSHILAIRFQGRNVNRVLDLTVDEALKFFARHPAIVKRLEALGAVGLGYLQLGQATSTLSGGEAQRLKLARFLLSDLEPVPRASDGSPRARMFLLDEPTTGLASSDVRQLLRVLSRLVQEGNTVVVIEHHLEFIAQSDYVIDLGPGGGDEGGRLVAAGSPLAISKSQRSQTGRELRRVLGLGALASRAAVPIVRRTAGAGASPSAGAKSRSEGAG